MSSFLFFALALLTLSVNAQNSVPHGYSEWFYESACDAECRSAGRGPLSLYVWLIRQGESLCGLAEEEHGPSSGKSPSGRFAGRQSEDHFNIRYTNSFALDAEFGVATLTIKHAILTIKVVKQSSGGWLGFDAYPMKRLEVKRIAKDREERDPDYASCMKHMNNVDEYLIEQRNEFLQTYGLPERR